MPENPGADTGSHGEAGIAGEQVHVVRRDAADHEKHEARPAADSATQAGWGRAYIEGRYGQQETTEKENGQ